MDCRELDNLLYPYLDGELVEGDRVALESHMSACEKCRAATDKERSLLLLIRSRAKQGTAEAPASLKLKLTEQLAYENGRRRARTIGKITAAAAGLCVCTLAAHHSYRTYQRQQFIQDAVNRHARAYPMEIERPSADQLEAWFDGKLDHRVAVPQFRNVTTRGGRLINVRDRQAAYIRYDASGNRRLGLFVYGDKPGDVDVPDEGEVDQANGFNTVTWREGDVVYTLVTDLNDDDIRQMLPQRQMPAQPAGGFQPASFRP